MLDEDRLMLDRSPHDDELGSGSHGLDDLGDSGSDLGDDDDDELMETTADGERVIYPWMQKVHVAGFGEYIAVPLARGGGEGGIDVCRCAKRRRVRFVTGGEDKWPGSQSKSHPLR